MFYLTQIDDEHVHENNFLEHMNTIFKQRD